VKDRGDEEALPLVEAMHTTPLLILPLTDEGTTSPNRRATNPYNIWELWDPSPPLVAGVSLQNSVSGHPLEDREGERQGSTAIQARHKRRRPIPDGRRKCLDLKA